MGSKCSWQSRIAVTLLVLVLATGALSGAVTAQDGTTVTVEDEETLSTGAEYGSAYSASSAETDEGTVSPTASDDERTVSPTASDDDGGDRAVAVSVIPNASSFGSDETMNILVGAFNKSGFKQPIVDATLNVTVQRPDGTTSQFDRQTGADGDAEVDYDLSNDNQNGTYTITVDDTSSDASATVNPDVGPGIIPAERDFGAVLTGTDQTLSFLVRNSGYGVNGEEINITTVNQPADSDIDSQVVETDTDGFTNITVTPTETGYYEFEAEVVSTGATATHSFTAQSTVLKSDYDFGKAIMGETFSYGGYLEDSSGLLQNEPVDVVITDQDTGDEVVDTSTTTDNSGFLLIESQIDTAGEYRVNVSTDLGPTSTTEDYFRVRSPSEDDSDEPDSDVELDISSRSDEVTPGSNAIFDIEATDNGSAIANEQIEVFARVDYDGAPLHAETVTTNESGMAVVEVPTPSDIDGTEIDGEAQLTYNDSTYMEDFDAESQQYDLNVNFYSGAEVGSTATFDASVEALDGSGSDANLPVQYNALYSERLDSYATGELVTNESVQVSIPRDLRPSRAVVPFSRYENTEDASLYYVRMFEFPGTAELSGASGETDFGRPIAEPGDQLTVDFTTNNGSAPSGFAFTSIEHNSSESYAESAIGDDISTESDATLTIPEYAGEDGYNIVKVWTADSEGRFYVAEVPFQIDASPSDDDGGGGGGEISANLTASPTTDVEAGTNVSFTAEATDFTATEYRWDFDGDGNIERTTSTNQTKYEYTIPGSYGATVTAVGDSGATAEATVDIEVVDTIDPTAVLEVPAETVVNTPVTFDASGSTDNGKIANYTFAVENESGVINESTTENATVTGTPNSTGNYNISVTVTDLAGNTNTTSKNSSVISSSNLRTTVTADDPQRFGEPVNTTITVNNTGDQNTTEPFTVRYNASGTTEASDGSSIEGNLSIDQNISGGGSVSQSVNLTDWVTENNITGEVTVDAVANVNDNVTDIRPLDNSDTTTFSITYANLTVATSASDATTAITNTTLNAYVRNTGTANSTATTARVTVTNSTGSEVVNTTSPVAELSTDGRNQTTLTRPLDSGTYTLSATVDDPGSPGGNSATENFTIAEYNLSTAGSRVASEVEIGQNTTAAFFYRTNDTATVNATLDLNGTGLDFQPDENASKNVTPALGQRNFVTYDLQATDELNTTELKFNVSDLDDTETDSASESVDISLLTRTNSSSTNLVVNTSESDTSTLTIYNNERTEAHNLSLSVQAGADGRTLQGLEYLVEYPYGCVEQTTSDFLGALNTDQYYRDREGGSVDDDVQDRINGSIAEGVADLNETGVRGQQDNTRDSIEGSWNMWGRDGASGETYYSVYALLGTSSVANDEVYGQKNSDALDGVDFNDAVDWLNKDQNDDGSFYDYSYIDDRPGMTGFTMIALEESNQTERVTDDTRDEITSIYASSAEYLIETQEDSGEWDEGDNPDKSTALAVHGLQIALEADADEKSDLSESQIQSAIDDGTSWLVENQNEDDGSWDEYYDSGFWNYEGDKSLTTAYTVMALNETGMSADNETISDGTDYLISVYEDDGSWGYPRATAMSIEALTQLTSGAAEGTLDITLDGDAEVTKEVTVSSDNPQETISLTKNDLADLRADGEGTTSVSIDVNKPDTGQIIVGVENTQEIIATTGGN